MKKTVRIPVTFESAMSLSETEEKLDAAISKQKELKLYKMKGHMLYLWERSDKNVRLKYFHDYKNDMCDTMFHGELKEGFAGSQLDGEICKPKGIWICFWGFIALVVIILLAWLMYLMLDPEFEFGSMLPMLVLIIPSAFICYNFLKFDKKRLENINKFLREFMMATNVDVLGEDLEDDDYPQQAENKDEKEDESNERN